MNEWMNELGVIWGSFLPSGVALTSDKWEITSGEKKLGKERP